MKRDVLLGGAVSLAAGAFAWLLWGHPETASKPLKSVDQRVIEKVHPDEER